MGNPYPAEVIDANEQVRAGVEINFTDPDNQPGGGSLPEGWTQDPDTGQVDTDDQNINAGAGEIDAEVFALSSASGRFDAGSGTFYVGGGGRIEFAVDGGGTIDMGNNGTIENLADPTGDQDADTKGARNEAIAAGGFLVAQQATFVDPATATAEDIANALINANIMAFE